MNKTPVMVNPSIKQVCSCQPNGRDVGEINRSSVLTEGGASRRPGLETGVTIASGVCRLAGGAAMLLLPFAGAISGAVIFAAGWLLLFCLVLTLVRAIAFNRGFPDFVMALFTAALYALAGWAVGTLRPGSLSALEDFRLLLALLLICTGVTRVLAFAGLWGRSRIKFPLLPVYGIAEAVGAVAMISGFPGSATAYIAVIFGLLMLLGAMEAFTDARRLSEICGPTEQKS